RRLASPSVVPYTTLFRSTDLPIRLPKGSAGGRESSRQRAEAHAQGRHGVASRGAAFLGAPCRYDDAYRRAATISFATAEQRSGRSEEHTSELQSPYDLVC